MILVQQHATIGQSCAGSIFHDRTQPGPTKKIESVVGKIPDRHQINQTNSKCLEKIVDHIRSQFPNSLKLKIDGVVLTGLWVG